MGRYIVRRLIYLFVVLLVVSVITFGLMHAVPGGPFDKEKKLPAEIIANLNKKYHLDKPLYQQFLLFVGKAVRGDFGQSFVYKTRTVAEIIVQTFPVSLWLGTMAFVLAVAGGLTLGILGAMHQNRAWDYASVSLATFGVAVPNFVMAVFAIVLFSFAVLPKPA